ncbi:MAG: hypothetical protein IT324_17340 [Anaerolineae bacterium]|nr:hypothetical protein [Anaerolineae bacterium]
MSQQIFHEVPAAHLVSAVLQSDTLLNQLQRELYRALPGITVERLRQLLRDEILQREMIEGHAASEAQALLKRMEQLKARGLSPTQTLRAVTGQASTDADNESDAFHILFDDKRYAGEGG